MRKKQYICTLKNVTNALKTQIKGLYAVFVSFSLMYLLNTVMCCMQRLNINIT